MVYLDHAATTPMLPEAVAAMPDGAFDVILAMGTPITDERPVLVAPDSFKGSLSALEAADAMARGIHAVFPGAEVITVPIADGGEGTVEALVAAKVCPNIFLELSSLMPHHLGDILAAVPSDRLWVVPDCGFWATPRSESAGKLRAMVDGAQMVRAQLQSASASS